MSKKLKTCYGCGVELQNISIDSVGYTPKELNNNEDVLCKRCFSLKHYGKNIDYNINKEDYKNEIYKLLDKVELVIPVFDIINFEISFNEEILDILREKESIVVINKIDLLPKDKHPSETALWVKNRLEEEGIVPLDLAIVSSKNNYGINGIYKKINHFFPKGVKSMMIGVTNVGKSSIINKLIGNNKITISNIKGTTLKSIENKIEKSNIVIYDTPGIIPEFSFDNFLCLDCSSKLISKYEISRKTFKNKPNRSIIISNFLYFDILNKVDEKVIFSLFLPREISFHETDTSKVNKFFNKDFFEIPCKKCIDEYNKNKNKIKNLIIKSGEDLVINGLGWISVKSGILKIKITYPEFIQLTTRKSLIQPKR